MVCKKAMTVLHFKFLSASSLAAKQNKPLIACKIISKGN